MLSRILKELDHKVANDPLVGPELRPIMAARVGPNSSLAQISCKILRAISDDVKSDLMSNPQRKC